MVTINIMKNLLAAIKGDEKKIKGVTPDEKAAIERIEAERKEAERKGVEVERKIKSLGKVITDLRKAETKEKAKRKAEEKAEAKELKNLRDMEAKVYSEIDRLNRAIKEAEAKKSEVFRGWGKVVRAYAREIHPECDNFDDNKKSLIARTIKNKISGKKKGSGEIKKINFGRKSKRRRSKSKRKSKRRSKH